MVFSVARESFTNGPSQHCLSKRHYRGRTCSLRHRSALAHSTRVRGKQHASKPFRGLPIRDQIGCCIRIKGHLDHFWREWFEGLDIVPEAAGTLRLTGSLQDRAALHGVLTKLCGLGVTVLALENSTYPHRRSQTARSWWRAGRILTAMRGRVKLRSVAN